MEQVLRYLLAPVFGFAIGFVTNALAIRMLFRPYRERRFLGVRFHGMIPRRKPEIAANVSRIVVGELLREQRVSERIAGPEVRAAAVGLVQDASRPLLEREWGALAEILPEPRRRVLEDILLAVLEDLAAEAERWLSTEAGERALATVIDGLLDTPPARWVPGEQEVVCRLVADKVREVMARPELEGLVHEFLGRLAVRVAGTERPLAELLPAEVLAGVRHVVRATVPSILGRFEAALLSAPNVRRIKRAIRAGIDDYLLETEGGLVKNLVRQAALVGRDRIVREADAVVDGNLHRLRDLIHEDENRAQVERSIDEALDGFVGRTPGQVLAQVPAQDLEGALRGAARWLTGSLRKPAVAEGLASMLEREVDKLFHAPLRDLFLDGEGGNSAAERWGRDLARAVADGGVRGIVAREGRGVLGHLLALPIGRPARFLPPHAVTEFADLALDHLLPTLAGQVPELLRIIDVQGLVEREILAFSPEEVERVILGVASRELRAITWWGGVLGALVGGLQLLVSLWGG